MCAVTREALPVDELLRFVAGPDGVLTPDLRRKLPGRGVNLRASAAVLREAIRRKAFERALKAPVKVPATLVEDVARLMRKDALQQLALANKAGLVVAGFAKVESCLANRNATALLSASDGAADGLRKLMAAERRAYGEAADRPACVTSFSSADFQLALGRDLVIHAALLLGPAAGGFLDRWRRLVRYESGEMPAPTAKSRCMPMTSLPTGEPQDR